MHLMKGAARFAFVGALAFAFSSQFALAQHAAKDKDGDGQIVAKDNNGNLRKPTAEEAAELTKGAKPRTPLSELPKTVSPTGRVGYVLDETYESTMVATRNADGKVSVSCEDQHDPASLTNKKKAKSKKSAKAPVSEVPRAEAQ
jgi:hypothetical protein